MVDPVKRRWPALGDPTEVLKEPDVGQLHVRDHPPSAEQARGRHGKSHQLRAQVVGAMLWQHRQAVAFPLSAASFKRV